MGTLRIDHYVNVLSLLYRRCEHCKLNVMSCTTVVIVRVVLGLGKHVLEI